MRLLALSTALLVLASCQQGPSPVVTPVPGEGAISIQVVPNPIVAKRASGDTYDFPFEVVVRETGGRAVNVNRVTARVMLPGGFPVANESWDAERIRSMGFGTTVAANGELRYRFTPRKDVPDERLFNGVSAELRVEATDDTGKATDATTTVTVTR
ncbi:MAG TPA: hypothetical protein VEK57_22065 [Thermoanaerobaculia bacterium]|nr:hypothetical protein [Thermoanaerobaculia bacterium]